MSQEPLAPTEVGLDDLFGRTGSMPSRFAAGGVTGSPGARWLLGRLLFSLALSAVIYGLLYFGHLVVPYPLLLVTIFVTTLLKYVLAGVAAQPLPQQLTGRGIRPMNQDSGTRAAVDATQDGVALAVGRWTSRLTRFGRVGAGAVPRRAGWGSWWTNGCANATG